MTEKFGQNVVEAGSLLANKFGEEAKAKRHEAAIALEEAEKAKAENNNETNRTLVKQARDNFETASREAKEWETGGSQRLVIDSALNVISTALAGRPAAEVVASGLSPAVNNQIKKATTDAKGNVNTALNLTAHALWGAVEAYAGNRNVAAGAAGAAGGEAAAHFLASTLYDKSPEKLSEEEKRTVSSLSQVAAGIAGGSLSDSSDGAIIAAKTAKDAVENNNFALDSVMNNPQVDWTAEAKAQEKISEAERQAMEAFEKEHPELVKKLKTTGDIASFVADLTPGIGDIKSFAEAEDGLDYALATVGLIPGAEIVTKPLKAAKVSYQKARAAEKLGNLAEAAKHQQEAARYIDNSVNGIYDSKEFRKAYEDVYGKANVRSTTVVENPRSTINNRTLSTGERLEVITSEKGKAVRITTKDEFGEIKEIANIPYDSRGLPIFDDVAKFTTSIKKPENYTNSEIRRKKEMVNATLELKAKILDGSINKSTFTDTQLKQIMKGKDKIDGFTWHHNAQSSPNNMQLVPTNIHDAVKHIGEGALSEGR